MQNSLRPALWIVAGMALVAFSDNFIPRVSEAMGLWQLQVTRAVAALPLVVIFVILTGQFSALRPRSAWRMTVRSLFSIIGLMLYFAALPAVSIAQAAAGLFTSPIWIALITLTVLRERVQPRRIVSIVLGFAGVCVVLGVGVEPIQPMALVAVVGGLFFGMSVIWTRRKCSEESAVGMAFWQFVGFLVTGALGLGAVPWLAGFFSSVPGAEFAITGWKPMSWETVGLVTFVGLSGVIATAFIAVGYKTGEPTVVGLFDFSFLIWAPFFAWLIWDQEIESRAILGMAMILTAGLLTSISRWSFGRRLDPSG